jgi:16S rRNA (guanine966-N2)-methyltransferase
VFLDPPYSSGIAAAALTALDAAGWLTPDALAVVELAAREHLAPPAGFSLIDERVYGAPEGDIGLIIASEGEIAPTASRR